MFAVMNASGVVCALRATDEPIADVFTIVAVGANNPPSVGDIGSQKSDGSWTFAPPKTEVSLDELKSVLKAGIDSAAEAERLKYITPGAGQALTYLQKADEAKRLLSLSEEPKATDFPLLAAEVGITADTLKGVASSISTANDNWQRIGAAIESIRLGAKKSVDSARSEQDARDAAVVEWPD